MVKRKLDNNEIKICERQLKSRGEKIGWLQYQLKYYDLMLSEGLEQNYLKTIREFKNQKSEYESELKAEQEVIAELKRQMKDGVEIKEVAPVEETSDKEMKKYCQ